MTNNVSQFAAVSPFTPGVGLEPRFLAGRSQYLESYRQRLTTAQTQQKNTLIFGLRGVGKSVLMKNFAAAAFELGYVPVLKELSKRNNNEDELILSLLADIAIRLKGVTISRQRASIGINQSDESIAEAVDLSHLVSFFSAAAGDKGDKLVATLIYVSTICTTLQRKGLVLLFDEFQLLDDDASKNNYAMSLVLDAISRIQSSTSHSVHAVIAGLPTVLGKMAESKPHIERLFSNVIDLGALTQPESILAISQPLLLTNQQDKFSDDLTEYLGKITDGYPFFIQYFANEAYEAFQHKQITKTELEQILPEIHTKLDEHFYSPRFSNLTPKERAIVLVSSLIDAPFSPTELLKLVHGKGGEITMGAIQQYLLSLQEKNILYKVRRGTYDYAIPLLKQFLTRSIENGDRPDDVIKELGQR